MIEVNSLTKSLRYVPAWRQQQRKNFTATARKGSHGGENEGEGERMAYMKVSVTRGFGFHSDERIWVFTKCSRWLRRVHGRKVAFQLYVLSYFLAYVCCYNVF